MEVKLSSKKRKISSIAFVLLLVASIVFVALPAVFADEEEYMVKNTYAVCGATPNPVGVDQEVLIWVGITDALYAATDGWEGLTVTVTKPDGETETLGPFRTDSTGSTGTGYVPRMVGTYTFQTHFPAQWFNWTRPSFFDPNLSGPIWYEASDSDIVELDVQQDPIPHYPGVTLPNEYWTRPIDGQHWAWASIAGNWFTTPPNSYAPYNDAPETAHILWAKPLVAGGLAGGEVAPHAYECGDAYEGKFSGSVVLGGVLYYNKFESRMPTREVVAVDLKTGEELWCKPLLDPDGVSRRLSFGQQFYWDSFNYHGVFGYLWATVGSTWHAHNPVDGEWIFSMTGVPSGTNLYGPNGEIYRYTINLRTAEMTLWNSSRTVNPATTGGMGDGSWRPHGNTYDADRGIEWTKSIPEGLPGGVNAVFFEGLALGTTATGWTGTGEEPIEMWAFSLEPGREGELLFRTSWDLPHADLTINYRAASIDDCVFVISCKETRQWWGFNLTTGHQLWGPTESGHDMGIYGMLGDIAYGNLYAANRMGGVLSCFDVVTGDLLWEYEAYDPYNEILWSKNWPIRTLFISDGKIYLGHSEHSPIDPKPRGAPFICLDAVTGEEIFRADGLFRQTDWGGRAIIGDSVIATMDTYDQRIYAIGKGPSETSVLIQNNVINQGSNVLIQGRVTDISPGTLDPSIALRFPQGVPAVADENMSEWMRYVYKQYTGPLDVSGVEVTLTIRDPAGEYYITTAVSDSSGLFSHMWSPSRVGEYHVTVEFKGSNAYYPSSATTVFGVAEADVLAQPVDPTPTPPPTDEPSPQPTPPVDDPSPAPAPEAGVSTDLYIIIAVVAVVAVVGLSAAFLFKKRK